MRAQITALQLWKSEHSNIEQCEDALKHDLQHGLFVIADGVGTAAYANIWSRLLVDHYVTCPLLSNCPFEVEWWLSKPQQKFLNHPRMPREITPKNYHEQKIRDVGSFSTLATLRVISVGPQTASARALAFGDSCVMRVRDDEVWSFPLKTKAEFDANPICLPSKPQNYNRRFHVAQIEELDLLPGDVCLLATDAVAKWIIGGDSYGRSMLEAFHDIVTITSDEEWHSAVVQWRTSPNAMRDDDSTALIIRFFGDDDYPGDAAKVGCTTDGQELYTVFGEAIQDRLQAFEKARTARDSKHMAIIYGDGVMMQAANNKLPEVEIDRLRQVADAWKEVFDAVQRKLDFQRGRQGINDVDLEMVWHHNCELLHDEPSAQGLRQTLGSFGVNVSDPLQPVSGVSRNAPLLGQEPQLSKDCDALSSARPILNNDDGDYITSIHNDTEMHAGFAEHLRVALKDENHVFIVQHANDILALFKSDRQDLTPEECAALSKVFQQLEALTQFWQGCLSHDYEKIVSSYRRANEFGYKQFSLHADDTFKEAVQALRSRERSQT